MKQVFVITSGCYSDYGIEHICSSKEVADEIAEIHNKTVTDKDWDGWYVSEWQLTDKLPDDFELLPVVKLKMDIDGDSYDIEKSFIYRKDYGESVLSLMFDHYYRERDDKRITVLSGYVKGHDVDRAVKVMNERRIILKSQDCFYDTIDERYEGSMDSYWKKIKEAFEKHE